MEDKWWSVTAQEFQNFYKLEWPRGENRGVPLLWLWAHCAVFGLLFSMLGMIHLVFFGAMFDHNAISFALISSESGWDPSEKAKICYSGAIIYAFTLFLSLLALLYFKCTKPVSVQIGEPELV